MCLSVGLSVCLSVGLSAGLSVGLSARLSVGLSADLSVGLSARLSIGLSADLSDGVSACLSVGLSACLSVGLSAALSAISLRGLYRSVWLEICERPHRTRRNSAEGFCDVALTVSRETPNTAILVVFEVANSNDTVTHSDNNNYCILTTHHSLRGNQNCDRI